ncbi:hypothetical protein HHK36_013123 [Tetracentron sinense]|uniref:Uncharacterized protein n=1 Tax=Tetracentron sinense TaxID=13715 RepID=A0A834ZE38_TETSI|nr:hypothetical protein HHK36_013123 [Tetracentron sinense]
MFAVVEILENIVFVANATNFVMYFKGSMHYSVAESSNMGLIMLTVQAQYKQFQPATGRRPSNSQAVVLYTGLYAMAAGVGGVKASLQAHGADQLDHTNQRLMTGFFNWFFFSLCTGCLIAATVMFWVEENKGWKWSFIISVVALSFALCIFAIGFPFYRYKHPSGSPLTRMLKVRKPLAYYKLIFIANDLSIYVLQYISFLHQLHLLHSQTHTHKKCRFLERAMIDDRVSSAEVEESKTFLGLLPIFASTIMMNCCLAQLQTFSIHQGNTMNRNLNHNFEIPTPSLLVFPLVIILLSVALYESFAAIFVKKRSSESNMFQPLKRIGMGLVLASASMAVAAVVESKRREAAENAVALSVFWLGWQYLLLGISDMLTLGGMLEFFYSEAPDSMRSTCTALSWCSNSMGYFLSSVLVSVTNSVSGKFGGEWLGGNDLNQNRLDLFYTLLCVLNVLNFLNYLYWAKRF